MNNGNIVLLNLRIMLILKENLTETVYFFFPLLQIALLLRFDFNIEQIKQELVKRTDITLYSINKLFDRKDQTLLDFGILYELYQSKDYLYNFIFQPVLSSEMGKQKISPPKYPKAKDLSSEFYKGFGEDLYSSF